MRHVVPSLNFTAHFISVPLNGSVSGINGRIMPGLSVPNTPEDADEPVPEQKHPYPIGKQPPEVYLLSRGSRFNPSAAYPNRNASISSDKSYFNYILMQIQSVINIIEFMSTLTRDENL